ncbi:MAG: hypothetical protein SH868_11390 [Bythopirellula sp.]|nr:hypothetical protein [Bythopirellula sp.]
METNLSAAPRSLVRRLLWPAGMAVAVLGVSGGGAYWCMNGTAEAETDAANPLSAHSAKEELKNLFAAEKNEKEQVTTITPVVGDRYGSYTPTAALPPLVEEEAKLPRKDVTRGQGPDGNVLRSSGSAVQLAAAEVEATPTIDARTAFAEVATPQAATPTPADPLAAALQNAKPLEKSPPVTANNPFAAAPTATPAAPSTAGNSRYSAPVTTPSLPPAMDLGAADAALAARQPTPAFPIEETQIPTPAEPQLASLDRTDTGITPTPGLGSQPGSGRPGEQLLEGSQTPSLTILKLAPPEIQVGKRCTFGIRVQNTGQRTAQNVQIHDEIPLGTELVGTAPRAAVSGGKVVWDLGTLSVGEERTVELELIPTEEGELGSVATVTMAAQASAKSRCTKPELALRLSSQPQVHAGQQHLVQIEISNPGSGEATGVMIMETVPAGVSHEAGPALEFEIGTLAPGETRRTELVLTAEQAGRVTNTMTAKADAGLHVDASCEFEVIAPDLQVTVAGPERRFLERPATYQVTIDNPGTAPAKEVQLVTHLPKGLQFVSANNLGEYDAAAHSVIWSLAELPANERGTVELVALPVEPGQHTLQFSTKARDGLTDETQKEVTVEGIAALMFEVVDMDDPIEVGGDTSYEIRVVNQGSKAAANVQVLAIMPPGLRALSGHGDTRHTVQGDRVVFAPLPQLGPKAETTFRIQAQGVRDGDHRIKVQITTDEIREPITKEESTRVYADH